MSHDSADEWPQGLRTSNASFVQRDGSWPLVSYLASTGPLGGFGRRARLANVACQPHVARAQGIDGDLVMSVTPDEQMRLIDGKPIHCWQVRQVTRMLRSEDGEE